MNDVIHRRALHEGGPPTIRLYTFNPGVLSIGHTHSEQVLNLDMLRAEEIEACYRPSSGGATLTMGDHALCVSVTCHRDQVEDYTIREMYRLVNRTIAEGMRRIGVDAFVSDHSEGLRINPTCFGMIGDGEVVARNGAKLYGCGLGHKAGHAFMESGMIPLDDHYKEVWRYVNVPEKGTYDGELDSEHESSSVGSELGYQVSVGQMSLALREAFGRVFPVYPGEIEVEEDAKATVLMETKYRDLTR